MTATIEMSTDDVHWSETDEQPKEGTFCRFTGDGHLEAIHECICGGILNPADIADRCGLPAWSVEDLLNGSDSEVSGDYERLRREWRYACQVRDFLRHFKAVLDMTDEDGE